MNIKKGDNVIIVTGKDKGKKGKVARVFPRRNLVLVENMNVKKYHQKPKKSGEKGQILSVAAPIDASNVMLADPKTGEPTRIGMRMEKGKKIRVAKKSGTVL